MQVYEAFGIDGIAQSYCILYYGAGILTDNFCQNCFCGLDAVIVQGNRIKLWPRQGFHEGNLVKSLHGIDVS